jgi:anti-sigma B factor antagonist
MRPTEFAAELLWTAAHVAVIALGGEIDAYTAPRLRAAAEWALQRGAKSLVIDLGEVEFIDAAGLGVIADAARRLGAGAVAVVTARRSVTRILHLVGLDCVLELFETREQALCALTRA